MELTFEAINERNAHFWRQMEEKLLDTISTKPSVFQEALKEVEADSRKYPIYYQRTLEQVVIDVEKTRKLHQEEFSRLGVKAKKADELNKLIGRIVRQRSTISCNELLDELKRREKTAPIQSIEGEEILLYCGKTIPLSGLKDRLSRAKKKNNRNP